MSRDSVSSALGDRKVLPRWRAPAESTDELAAVRLPRPIQMRSSWLEKLELNFEESQNIETGRELVETSRVLGVDLPHQLYQDILRTGYTPLEIPNKEKSEPHPIPEVSSSRTKIRELRAQLSQETRQPFAWTELSRNYLSIGSADKAERAMQCALALAPENRYVLRSATRLFELIGDPGQGLHALKRSGRLSSDPWLLSADIALDGDRHSNSIKLGMRMLETDRSTPRNMTELAAAIGTVEHVSGRHKLAKKMFAQSLLDPNENSIAQAIYISQSDSKIILSDEILDRPLTYEARARHSFACNAWSDSMEQSWKWLKDEPFDTRPAVLGSCLGFVNELASQAHAIATAGLQCAPNDVLLLNNRSVAGAYLGKLNDAYTDVSQALKYDASEAYLLATLGLIAYRSGDFKTGSRAYGMSIAWLAQKKEREAVIRAYLYWLREAVRAGQINGTEELNSARKIVEKRAHRDIANEVPGLFKAIEIEIDMRNAGYSAPTEDRNFTTDSLLELEGKIPVPQEARDLYPAISENTIPAIDKVEHLTQ